MHQWECAACNMLNAPASAVCQTCGGKRPAESDDELGARIAPAPGYRSDYVPFASPVEAGYVRFGDDGSQSGAGEALEWRCPRCTLINDADNRECGLCLFAPGPERASLLVPAEADAAAPGVGAAQDSGAASDAVEPPEPGDGSLGETAAPAAAAADAVEVERPVELQNPLPMLPAEMHVAILSQLDDCRALAAASATCKFWYFLARDWALWRRVSWRPYAHISTAQLEALFLARAESIVRLDLSGCHAALHEHALLARALRPALAENGGALRELRVCDCHTRASRICKEFGLRSSATLAAHAVAAADLSGLGAAEAEHGQPESCQIIATGKCPRRSVPFSRLFGRVRFVQHFADYKVAISPIPDMRVAMTGWPGRKAGEWQIVQHGEDFTVEMVAHFADFTIQYVDHAPGVTPAGALKERRI